MFIFCGKTIEPRAQGMHYLGRHLQDLFQLCHPCSLTISSAIGSYNSICNPSPHLLTRWRLLNGNLEALKGSRLQLPSVCYDLPAFIVSLVPANTFSQLFELNASLLSTSILGSILLDIEYRGTKYSEVIREQLPEVYSLSRSDVGLLWILSLYGIV